MAETKTGSREVASGHRAELDDRKRAEMERLIRLIDVRHMSEDDLLTGWYVSPSDAITVE